MLSRTLQRLHPSLLRPLWARPLLLAAPRRLASTLPPNRDFDIRQDTNRDRWDQQQKGAMGLGKAEEELQQRMSSSGDMKDSNVSGRLKKQSPKGASSWTGGGLGNTGQQPMSGTASGMESGVDEGVGESGTSEMSEQRGERESDLNSPVTEAYLESAIEGGSLAGHSSQRGANKLSNIAGQDAGGRSTSGADQPIETSIDARGNVGLAQGRASKLSEVAGGRDSTIEGENVGGIGGRVEEDMGSMNKRKRVGGKGSVAGSQGKGRKFHTSAISNAPVMEDVKERLGDAKKKVKEKVEDMRETVKEGLEDVNAWAERPQATGMARTVSTGAASRDESIRDTDDLSADTRAASFLGDPGTNITRTASDIASDGRSIRDVDDLAGDTRTSSAFLGDPGTNITAADEGVVIGEGVGMRSSGGRSGGVTFGGTQPAEKGDWTDAARGVASGAFRESDIESDSSPVRAAAQSETLSTSRRTGIRWSDADARPLKDVDDLDSMNSSSLGVGQHSVKKSVWDGPQEMPEGPGKRATDASGNPMETGTRGS